MTSSRRIPVSSNTVMAVQHGLRFFKGQHNLFSTVHFRQSNTVGRVIRQVLPLNRHSKHGGNQPHILPDDGVHPCFTFVDVKHIFQRHLQFWSRLSQ